MQLFIEYARYKAKTWKPQCWKCHNSELLTDIEDEWTRPLDCECIAMSGLNNQELTEFDEIIHSSIASLRPCFPEHALFKFEKRVVARYEDKISRPCILDRFIISRNTLDAFFAWRLSHNDEKLKCGLVKPLCEFQVMRTRWTVSLCLKRLNICKDMRIYIAKKINCCHL